MGSNKTLDKYLERDIQAKCIIKTALLVCLLSSLAIFYNKFATQYPGNNYLPFNIPYVFILVSLLYAGSILQFGSQNFITIRLREILYLLFIYFVIAIATQAVQYTPFSPIDYKIIEIENLFHLSVPHLLNWTYSNIVFQHIFAITYGSIGLQMTVIPLLIIVFGRFHLLREYYALLLITLLIGFTIYYFLPTTAPASVVYSPYFVEEQVATGLKFNQIHQYKLPTTIDGGLIAFPSFHIIWAWLCLYLIRPWKIAFSFLLVINGFLTASCVMLGWHYISDVIGSFFVILIAHFLLNKYCRQQLQ